MIFIEFWCKLSIPFFKPSLCVKVFKKLSRINGNPIESLTLIWTLSGTNLDNRWRVAGEKLMPRWKKLDTCWRKPNTRWKKLDTCWRKLDKNGQFAFFSVLMFWYIAAYTNC